MSKITFPKKYFYCPVFDNRCDYENEIKSDAGCDIIGEFYCSIAYYMHRDRKLCLFLLLSFCLTQKIIRIDNKAYRWVIDSAMLEAKDELKDLEKWKKHSRAKSR